MANKSTFTGYLRTLFGGLKGTATPAVVPGYIKFSFDPTSSSQVSLCTVPKGTRVMDVVGLGGATGGTNPTVDIGTTGDDDGLANELDCDAGFSSAVEAGTTGALIGTILSATADTILYGKVGASAATGGTLTGYFVVIADDDGSIDT